MNLLNRTKSIFRAWHLSAEQSTNCTALTELAHYCSWTEDRDGFNFGEMLIEFRRSLPLDSCFRWFHPSYGFFFPTKNCTWLMAGKARVRPKEAIGVERGETEKLRTERKWLVFLFICYVPRAVILGYIITVSVYTAFRHSANKRDSFFLTQVVAFKFTMFLLWKRNCTCGWKGRVILKWILNKCRSL
jgi:hypothetical protein